MKRVLAAALAAASMAAVAAPALAQPYGYGHGPGPGYRQNINAREAEIARRIDMGERRGDLTRREALHLRAELRDIQALEARYRHNRGYYHRGPGGLSRSERAELDRRLDDLSRRVVVQRHDRDRRPYHR